jgi:hypothetical protein
MEPGTHTLGELFDQLGLASDEASIEAFIHDHRPLEASVRLDRAPFWNAAQQAFLRQQLELDGDWSELIDSLDTRFR